MQDPTLRIYAVLRGDLEMTAGKAAAQAGHAYVNSLLDALKQNPNIIQEYQPDGLGTKVCLVAKNESQLRFAHYRATERGLPCSLIIDSGHIMLPHFDGNPIVTALGIGPCIRDQIDFIVGKFDLL